MDSIRNLARAILFRSALNKPIEYLKRMLLREILLAVRDSEETHPRMNQLKKHSVLKRAADWMRERTREPAPLSELYQELSISERSAQIAFKDQFGLSLKTYYRNYRMTRVREALRNANRTRTVGEVAASFGYWHLGQFSKDYKNVIGELPSKTLKTAYHTSLN